MTIKTETRTVEITLKFWDGNTNAYSPDVFGDVETGFPTSHSCLDGSSVLVATDAEVEDLAGWWVGEVKDANDGSEGDVLAALDDDAIESGSEWVLFVDEVEL